jgi:hypothetical protein
MVNHDAPHQLRSRRDKMAPACQIGFVLSTGRRNASLKMAVVYRVWPARSRLME